MCTERDFEGKFKANIPDDLKNVWKKHLQKKEGREVPSKKKLDPCLNEERKIMLANFQVNIRVRKFNNHNDY